QPGKPLFNVKKSRLLHDPYSNQRKENGITEQTSIPEGFSNPPPLSYQLTMCDIKGMKCKRFLLVMWMPMETLYAD
ncbi:hypothetical protein, partial [Acetobacter fabarum]